MWQDVRPDPLAALVDRIYAAATLTESWPGLLREVAGRLGGGGASIIPLDGTQTAWRFGSHHDPRANTLYYEHWWRECPLRQTMPASPGTGFAFACDRFLSDEEVARHPYYQEYLRLFGVQRRLQLRFRTEAGQAFLFSHQKPFGQGHHSPAQLRAARRLAGHIRRSLSLAGTLEAGRVRQAGLEEAVMRLEHGVALLEPDGRVLLLNPALEALLGDGFRLCDSQLQATLPQEQAALARMLCEAGAAGGTARPAGMIRLRRPSGRPPLMASLFAISRPWAEGAGGLLRPGCLLLLVSPRDDAAEALLMQLGLSPAEARLAWRVGQGQTRREAAEALALAPGQAGRVLAAALRKLGVDDRQALADRLRDLPGLLAPPPRPRPGPRPAAARLGRKAPPGQ